MARRTGNAAVGARQFVILNALVDLTASPGDIPLTMSCPGDESILLGSTWTIGTVGVGDENHNLIIEHGAAGAGVAMSGLFDVHAGVTLAPVGTIVSADSVILAPDAQPATVYGTFMQVLNAEEGAISTGSICNVSMLWQL